MLRKCEYISGIECLTSSVIAKGGHLKLVAVLIIHFLAPPSFVYYQEGLNYVLMGKPLLYRD